MSAALPSALRLQSETSIKLHPDFKLDSTLSSDREYLIVEALDKAQQLTIADLSKLLSLKHVMPLIKSMLSKEIILVVEELARTQIALERVQVNRPKQTLAVWLLH